MNTRALLLAGLLFALTSAAQDAKRDLWTWKDQNGVTQYSDRPVPGARRVELSHVNDPDSGAPSVPTSPAGPPPSDEGESEEAGPVEYRRLDIVQPTEGQTFFGADATVDVSLQMQPDLAEGHRLSLYLDDSLIGGATNSLSYTIGNLPRGQHTLTAVIQDERGNDLLRSQPRKFNVRQPTTIPPTAVGPKLKPPPKPAPRPNNPG
jgi:hypothetical protein